MKMKNSSSVERNSKQRINLGMFLIFGLLGVLLVLGVYVLLTSIQLKPLSVQLGQVIWGIGFCLPGIVTWLFHRRSKMKLSYSEKRKILYPNNPWLWEKKWEHGKIRYYDYKWLILTCILIALAFLWNAFGWWIFSIEFQPLNTILQAPLFEKIVWGGVFFIRPTPYCISVKGGFLFEKNCARIFSITYHSRSHREPAKRAGRNDQ